LQAFYRAAKGALGLRKYERCMELCAQGLLVDAGNRELQEISRRAAVERDAQQQRDTEEQLRQLRIRSPARELAAAVLGRGWRVGRPQFTIGTWPCPYGCCSRLLLAFVLLLWPAGCSASLLWPSALAASLVLLLLSCPPTLLPVCRRPAAVG
jgi:hypothetical protein